MRELLESFLIEEACVLTLISSPYCDSHGDLGQGYTLKPHFKNVLIKCLPVPVLGGIYKDNIPSLQFTKQPQRQVEKEFEISVKESMESSEVLFGAKESSKARECTVASSLGWLVS